MPTAVTRRAAADGLLDMHAKPGRAQTMDFTCVETQIGDGDALDCEVVNLDGTAGFYRVQVPI